MPVDEFHLRNTARELADLYRQLNELKHTKPTPPEVRTMKPAPGPQTPGNWLILNTYIDQEQKLREIAFNAFADLGVKLRDDDAAAPRLCHLLAFHAQPISELDWASDLLDELGDQAKIIRRRINPYCQQESDGQQEIWLTAKTLTYKLRQQGYNVSLELLRKWAERGRVHSRKAPSGVNVYSLKDVLNLVHSN